MNPELTELAEEINGMISESPLYASYVRLKETVENDEELVETYRQLVSIGANLQEDQGVPPELQEREVPTAVKQFIAVQKELSEMLESVIRQMQDEIQ